MNILKLYKSYKDKINQNSGNLEEQTRLRDECKGIIEKEIKNVCN